MDSMVDIVFQLLVFFLFTFQVRLFETILPAEIALPRPKPAARPLEKDEKRPLLLRLEADGAGQLATATLDGQPLPNLAALPERLRGLEADRPMEKRQVELHPADGVHYNVVVEAAGLVARSRWTLQLGHDITKDPKP